jgi:hypothetical protein
MITNYEINLLAEQWIADFSRDPHVLQDRKMGAFFELSDLILSDPVNGLRVIKKMSISKVNEWVFEGIAVGPLRTFLMLYGGEYDQIISQMKEEIPSFREMYQMALQGMQKY